MVDISHLRMRQREEAENRDKGYRRNQFELDQLVRQRDALTETIESKRRAAQTAYDVATGRIGMLTDMINEIDTANAVSVMTMSATVPGGGNEPT